MGHKAGTEHSDELCNTHNLRGRGNLPKRVIPMTLTEADVTLRLRAVSYKPESRLLRPCSHLVLQLQRGALM